MRYAQIRSMDVSNGSGIGAALFVQGCHFHCGNCFNKDTWDFTGGKEWTPETKKKFLELIDKPYITRVSILGGEPLADENLDGVLDLVTTIKKEFSQKTIWLYSGYTIDQVFFPLYINMPPSEEEWKKIDIIKQCDVMVDGQYIDSQRDITLRWKGSANQRVIDVKKSLEQNEIILYCD